MRFILILFFSFTFSAVSSQTVCDSLKAFKKHVYGFNPAGLDSAKKERKSDELDMFWNIAKRHPAESMECLNKLLLEENNDPYFCFDASSLLLRLDEKSKYVNTVIKGLNKADLNQLQLFPFLQICFYLGSHGHDITALANKFISQHERHVYFENHAMTLNILTAGLFLYGIIPDDKSADVLIQLIQTGSPSAKHNALVILNLVSTEKGDSFVDSMIKTNAIPDSTLNFIKSDREIFTRKDTCSEVTGRSKILEYLSYTPYNFEKEFYGFSGDNALQCSAIKQLIRKDITLIRQARIKSMYSLSDEALHQYLAMTKILMTVRTKK